MVEVMGHFFTKRLSHIRLVKLSKILKHFKVVISGFIGHLSDTDSRISVAQLSIQLT